ncbi:hypothetical protein QYM36_018316 [Artemia franciscana]|uniref:SET domain-containing protein n=2 Tax=Artemia franciscana TaxID=6661 RepID=A0AA88H6V6_ARTSF|nr:hypothetical protein QYM36_018316 [Artemia franciscana]
MTAPEPTLTAPKLTAPAPEPTLTVPELTLTVPEAILTATRLTMPAPGLTLTAPETHPASLIAPENDSRNPSMTLAVSKDVKGKKPRNFFTICQFCHWSLYKLDKHFLAKKGTCSKNPNGELWSVKEAKEMHELAKDELAERSQNKSYFLASQVSSLVEETKTLHGFCKALSALTGIYFDPLNLPDRALSFDDTRPVTLPAPGPATPEGTCTHTHKHTHAHSAPGRAINIGATTAIRRVSEDSDPDDVVDSDEEGSLYAPESPEHKSSESEEEKSELRSQYYKKEWSYTSDVRKKMQKHGLYDIYTRNVKTAEEAKKMAYGIELMSKFEKWSAQCGDGSTKKYRNPFECARKIVYFILEGTKYNWKNFHSAERVELFFSKLADCGMEGSSRNKYAQGYYSILDKKQKSLATAEMRHRELQRTFDPNSFNTEDYRNLKAGVEKCMAPVIKRLSRNRLVDEDHINLTAYLCFLVSFMFGHRPGVPENMTVKEFLNRRFVEEENMFVILVEKHKTASMKSAGVTLSVREEVIFRNYLSFVRPALIKPDKPEPENFLLSMLGLEILNTSGTLRRFLEKIFPDGMRPGVRVPTQTTIRHLIATINRNATHLSKEERDMMFDYLCHSAWNGADLTEALTEEALQMAIRRIGYQDTVPSLELVQQTYSRLRIPKLFPSEPLVDEYLTTCVLNQSWPGMTVAQSLDKGAGQGVYATLPLYKNKVVVEYHGRRRATIEANRLLQSLLGEDDGSNYFLTVDQDVTIDAREKVCTCHPHQQCFGRLVNHKANEDSPNLKCKALVVDGLKIPFLVATQDITAGEELCFDYGVRPGQFNEGYEQI